MPQLDSLRALAMSTVLFHHLLDIRIGGLGVCIFFVLSGFLITGILLRVRDSVEDSGKKWYGIRQFYVRRFLRIFPLYYFAVALFALFDIGPTRDVIGWLLTYTFNFQVSIQGWFPANIAHFWTLSVEEQYYLLWPWIVLLAPRKRLGLIMSIIILLGPLYRLLFLVQGWNPYAMFLGTPSSMDTLGMGSLLALASHSRAANAPDLKRLMRVALIIGTSSAIVLSALVFSGVDWQANAILIAPAIGLICCWLVYSASQGFGGLVGRFLEARPLIYCGKISYGIYVYHLVVPTFFSVPLGLFGVEYPDKGLLGFTVTSALAVAIAALSWHLMEKPMNNLKRHFRYP